jgi:PAS domain S-box-containing protein
MKLRREARMPNMAEDPPVRILLLEDSEIDADLIEQHLARELDAFHLTRTGDRESYVTALESGAADIILSDYALPAFDGLSALALACEQVPDTPFIFVSGVLGEEFATEAMKRGATDYVLKQRLARLPASVLRALQEARERAERRRAEALLRESMEALTRNEEWLRLALEAGELGSWEEDLVRNEARQSPRYFQILGIAGPDPGLNLRDLRAMMVEQDQPLLDAALAEARAGAASWRFECRIRRPDGELRWIESRGRAVTGAGGEPVRMIGIVADITERKAAALALEQAVQERTAQLADANRALKGQIEERERVEATLRQMQRLEAVGQLTSGVAHDFNNLLTVILGNIDFIARGVSEPKQSARLTHVRQAAERGAKLTAQLLAFSRRQRLEPKPLDLNQTVAGMGDLLRSTMGGSVRLETVLKPGLWPALVDPTQIELVILNLAINARDAMQVGGALTIETANVVLKEEPRRPEEPPKGEYVMVSVTDTGSGMPAEVLERAFEPFFTTKDIGKGSGLGLSQVLGFAQQSGGGVRIDTREGEGASIKVYLPRAAVDAAEGDVSEDGQPDLPGLDARRSTILVVDDDSLVREITTAMLQDLGYLVVEAGSGMAALDELRTERRFDLLLVDFAMPGMNGAEVAQRALALRPDLPVLFVTGYADFAALKAVGEDRVVQKPFQHDELAQKVGRIIGGSETAADEATTIVAFRQTSKSSE